MSKVSAEAKAAAGKVEEGEPPVTPQAKEEPYLASWKTKEEAVEGFANMQKKMGEQGNEVGALRKQLEYNQQLINELQTKTATPAQPAKPEGPDYGAEIEGVHKELSSIQSKIEGLDPVDEGYSKELSSLLKQSSKLQAKSTALAAQAARMEAINAAKELFKKELDERDIQSTHRAFHEKNPDFNTPEMQARIREYLANDTTGMSDPLVAYREIQRDDAMEKATQLEAESAELRQLLKLKKGADETGTVIAGGQTVPPTKPPKARGADLDRGMAEALQRAKAA